ncbi:beta-ketoacyl-[acyl-carrier-protein] synthase family protein [Nocardiopsis alborubida]|uniref:Beta-ketoacyl-[acyl-carrier-protein] synthase family protein n=1 Tax=Nocardiopsis alborubida TaxID=146802 RepID=A0A7X6M9G3_9ACTN|nr:beta-ketoacyl-[acyl-carrier-protein] synthase family protein [Nocardiopsis alborubida]NKY97188.1 beta-ketoacyl-[acyl-carrier-protein] synthase family protein [Nocardiopsis alborubida]
MTNRVWVTGVGAVTPGGWSAEQTWTNVRDGVRFGTALERFPLFEAGTRVGAPVPATADQDLDTSQAVVYGVAAAREALESAGLPVGGPGPSADIAVVATHGERVLPGPDRDPLLGPTDLIVDGVRRTAAAPRATGLYGACAGGGLAVGSGMKLIESGQADVVLAGGADCLLREIDFFSFCSLYAMTNRDCPPEEASCPFDARRDGFLLSEGAGFVVLESERHARARGADPMACVEGFGFSQNAYHMVASPPDAAGPEYAMRRAMQDARIDPSDIGYVNAHGTSTRDNDWCETLAVHQAFGAAAETVPISSVKGALGHSMASAGAVETVLCVAALRDQVVPPTMNLKEPDPRCDLDYVPNVARDLRFDRVLNNSFGFGGHNATLILGKV